MWDRSEIDSLCAAFTNLTEAEIRKLEEWLPHLQMIADLTQADIFIDCPAAHGDYAMVVAEAHPATAPSLYAKPVVGQLAYPHYEPAVARTHRTGLPTMMNRAITQEGKHVKQNVTPIKNESGKVIGSMVMEQDVSKQVETEAQIQFLREATEQLSDTFIGMTVPQHSTLLPDMLQDTLVLLDSAGRIVFANTAGMELIAEFVEGAGYIGRPIQECLFFIGGIEHWTEGATVKEITIDHRVFQFKGVRLSKNGQTSGYILLLRDLSDLRKKEKELMVKSAVIQEIHHRVKNNLQAVASLLQLQIRRTSNEAKAILEESLNRIMTIATVHEVLSDKGIEKVNLSDIAQKIGKMLIRSIVQPEKNIDVFVTGEEIELRSARAVSFALIVHELIQNGLEHAFSQITQGFIEVKISKIERSIELSIIDNGAGLREEAPTGSSLGLQIVRTLTEHDLLGSFDIKPNIYGGTSVVIQFPCDREEERS